MTNRSRRDVLKLAGLTAAMGSGPLATALTLEQSGPAAKRSIQFVLGMASYTLRSFTLDQAIEMTKRLGLKKITLKDMHLPLNSPEGDIKKALEKIRGAGLELSSCGVVYMTTEAEVQNAFTYAKAAEIKMMVGVPQPPLLELTERLVKETDITLAIHNHGPTDERYPSPESAYRLIAKMDKRMGLCIDVGHTQRLGLDPSIEIERFFDRLYDVHFKDVSSADAKGTTVECGRGVIDIPKLLKTLVRLKYSRILHFEHEKDAKDPLAGVAESIGYVRGIMATL
jgi:inosose dehydratase